MRKVFIFLEHLIVTVFLSTVGLLASLFETQGKTLHRMSILWAKIHLKASSVQVSVTGIENMTSPPYIIMCNHQSALDIYSLLVALPLPFKWVAKRELFFIPFVGWVMKRAGYISLDRKHPREALKAIDDAARKIQGGINILIFPEGTRSQDGQRDKQSRPSKETGLAVHATA